MGGYSIPGSVYKTHPSILLKAPFKLPISLSKILVVPVCPNSSFIRCHMLLFSFHQSFFFFACSFLPDSPQTPVPTDPTTCPPTPPALPLPMAVVGGNGGREAGKYCCLCGAWFNNPLMAQQHYEGKKHRRNAARARLLEQLAGSLDATESTGQPLGLEPPRMTAAQQQGC